MAKKAPGVIGGTSFTSPKSEKPAEKSGTRVTRPSALVDTRVVYCGDNLEQLAKLPDACVDLIYIDPPFNSNRNYDVCPHVYAPVHPLHDWLQQEAGKLAPRGCHVRCTLQFLPRSFGARENTGTSGRVD